MEETGNGALKLKGDDIRLENSSGNNIIKAVGNSAELYENGSKKLETTSSGIDVTGNATFTKSGGGNIRIAETASRYVEIMGYAEGSANGSTMAFQTIEAGTSTSTERMRIDSSGNLLVGKTATAIGTCWYRAVRMTT